MIHTTAQLVASQAERDASGVLSIGATRVSQFMKINPSTFTGVKVEEDPQAFLDKMEKMFRVMQTTNVEEVNFATYQLKNTTYQWYEKWDRDRGDVQKLSL